MTENKWRFETGTVIDYKSESIAVLYLRYYGIFYENLLLSVLVKEF